jgi:hypothetical protein
MVINHSSENAEKVVEYNASGFQGRVWLDIEGC